MKLATFITCRRQKGAALNRLSIRRLRGLLIGLPSAWRLSWESSRWMDRKTSRDLEPEGPALGTMTGTHFGGVALPLQSKFPADTLGLKIEPMQSAAWCVHRLQSFNYFLFDYDVSLRNASSISARKRAGKGVDPRHPSESHVYIRLRVYRGLWHRRSPELPAWRTGFSFHQRLLI